jgi:hypothetical protein
MQRLSAVEASDFIQALWIRPIMHPARCTFTVSSDFPLPFGTGPRIAVGRLENPDAIREISTRYQALPTTPVVCACSRVSIRNPRTPMACILPFRPWHSPGPRVFGSRTTRNQSTNPAQVLSCTCTPPQWLALPLVAPPKRLGRPCLFSEAPRFGPRPFSVSKQESPFLRLACDQTFERLYRAARKSRLRGLATPMAA